LTIHALGDQPVNNNAYSGPQATAAPYNAKTVNRHYGFLNTKGSVSIGGVAVSAANITTWNDTTIVVNVPNDVPACPVQQQAQYGGPSNAASAARCGELVITATNGKQSIDAVTITVGGKQPTHIPATGSIQAAIDAASPGDLLVVDPGVHTEFVLMWKPVRLQGVGAASSVINANTHPAGRLDAWRRQVNCLFGLALNGVPLSATHPYDPTGTYSCPGNSNWKFFSDPVAGARGRPADAARAKPILDQLCRRLEHCGPVGSGAVMKLTINMPLMIYWQALGEALALCRPLGLDPARIMDLLSDTSGGPNVLKVRGAGVAAMLRGGDAGPVTFDVDSALKDLRTMLAEGKARGVELPLVEQTLACYEETRQKVSGAAEVSAVSVYWSGRKAP